MYSETHVTFFNCEHLFTENVNSVFLHSTDANILKMSQCSCVDCSVEVEDSNAEQGRIGRTSFIEVYQN